MAEIHNISDLKAIRLLENELLDVRDELRKSPGYDPAESLVENITRIMEVGRYFVKRVMYLRQVVENYKKEQENDKMAARTYPIAGFVGCANEICPTVTAGFTDYHPSGESVSERLLGSTDGYGR